MKNLHYSLLFLLFVMCSGVLQLHAAEKDKDDLTVFRLPPSLVRTDFSPNNPIYKQGLFSIAPFQAAPCGVYLTITEKSTPNGAQAYVMHRKNVAFVETVAMTAGHFESIEQQTEAYRKSVKAIVKEIDPQFINHSFSECQPEFILLNVNFLNGMVCKSAESSLFKDGGSTSWPYHILGFSEHNAHLFFVRTIPAYEKKYLSFLWSQEATACFFTIADILGTHMNPQEKGFDATYQNIVTAMSLAEKKTVTSSFIKLMNLLPGGDTLPNRITRVTLYNILGFILYSDGIDNTQKQAIDNMNLDTIITPLAGFVNAPVKTPFDMLYECDLPAILHHMCVKPELMHRFKKTNK